MSAVLAATHEHRAIRGSVKTPEGWRAFSALTAAYPEVLCAAFARLICQSLRRLPLVGAVDPALRRQGKQGRQETVVPVSLMTQHLLTVRAVVFLLLLAGLVGPGHLHLLPAGREVGVQLVKVLAGLSLAVALVRILHGLHAGRDW